jgi:DNA primase
VKNYGVFQADNKIYIYKAGYYDCVSNFSIEIVQHMQDENFPMKLIRICNVDNIEKIFDVKSDLINALSSFNSVVTNYGNFFYSASPSDHEKLKRYLFDKMGNGLKIEILGWQPEGFWTWNNKVIIPGNREEFVNKEGLFKYKDESYYIPSANKMYMNNMFKFGPQKKFKSIDTEITHGQYLTQVYKVHREHSITGILFGITSIFQDIVTANLNFFPILFYFGPASTGKDNLCAAIQSLMGLPQTAIQLEGGASTIKAQIREFSQFNNGISQLAEYKRGDPKLDGLIKGLWDRRGYKRGSLESKVATDEIPILCSTLLTGNDFPDAEALITRLLWEEMKAQEFDDAAKVEFNKLADMIKKGVSGLSDYFINKRAYIEEVFLDSYRANVKLLNDLDKFKDTTSRIISNLAVLLTTYHLFEKEIHFPFRQSEVINHFAFMVDNQKRKLATASPFIKFWDCFAMTMRGNVNDQLRINQDIRIEGGILMFNFKNAFMKVQRMWLSQYQESAPDQRRMKEILMEDSAFIKDGDKQRIDKSVKNNTSVFVVDLSKLGEIKDVILHNMNVQLNQNTLFSKENTDNSASNEDDEDDAASLFGKNPYDEPQNTARKF